MNRTIAGIFASLFLVAACRAQEVPARLWVFMGGETDPFCLELHSDSTATFYGGFTFHNPVRWGYDRSAARLDLKFANLTPSNYAVLRDHLARGYLRSLDTTSGTVSYTLQARSPSINVFNWILYPASSLSKDQLSNSRPRCPPLR